MFLAGSTDRWHWSEDAFPALNFCVDALLRDGLRVAPFDLHPDGDGSLRELGLDADVWHRWVACVLEQRAMLSRAVVALGDGRRADAHALGAGPANLLRRPPSMCPGVNALRARLDGMWASYEPTAAIWKRSMTIGDEADRRRGTPTDPRQRWDALIPFHDRLATLSVFLVAYSVPVLLVMPPTTCLIAPANDAPAYARQLVTAAELLASAA